MKMLPSVTLIFVAKWAWSVWKSIPCILAFCRYFIWAVIMETYPFCGFPEYVSFKLYCECLFIWLHHEVAYSKNIDLCLVIFFSIFSMLQACHKLCCNETEKRKLLFFVVVFHSVNCLNCLQAHGLQHSRFPCPSLSPGVCLNSHPLNW